MSEASSKTATDLKTIRKGAEEHYGRPSRVKSTAHKNSIGVLPINFPGYSGQDSLGEILWKD